MLLRDVSCVPSLFVIAACAGGPAEEVAPPEPSQNIDTPAGDPPRSIARPNPAPASAPPNEHAALVREIAASYGSWGAVDNQFHWAPGLCAMPADAVEHVSDAPADTPHGEKVFVLYALDAMAYWKATDTQGRLPASLARTGAPLTTRNDVEQVLVKESFAPAKADGRRTMGRIPARRDGESFGAGDPIGLFVMAKLGGDVEGTDEGWIYATVSPSGDVTAAGSIAACRDCHQQQADRVFGVPLHWK